MRLDEIRRARLGIFGSSQGAQNRNAKLTEAQVHEIRALWDSGGREDHAEIYGISGRQFRQIGLRLAWRSLEEK